jgi:hypothetical protein
MQKSFNKILVNNLSSWMRVLQFLSAPSFSSPPPELVNPVACSVARLWFQLKLRWTDSFSFADLAQGLAFTVGWVHHFPLKIF